MGATGNEDKIYQYALKVSGISDKKNLTIGVIVNASAAGGIASMSESLQSGIGYYSSIGNDPEAFGSTMRHELAGHAFAFLGDEYSNAGGSPTQAQISEVNRLYTSYGWYANLDFTNDAINRGQSHNNAPRRAANYVEWKPDSAPVVRP